jgi:hypothetical protein
MRRISASEVYTAAAARERIAEVASRRRRYVDDENSVVGQFGKNDAENPAETAGQYAN